MPAAFLQRLPVLLNSMLAVLPARSMWHSILSAATQTRLCLISQIRRASRARLQMKSMSHLTGT